MRKMSNFIGYFIENQDTSLRFQKISYHKTGLPCNAEFKPVTFLSQVQHSTDLGTQATRIIQLQQTCLHHVPKGKPLCD